MAGVLKLERKKAGGRESRLIRQLQTWASLGAVLLRLLESNLHCEALLKIIERICWGYRLATRN